MQELPTLQPTTSAELSPEEVRAHVRGGARARRRARRGDPRPQLPGARGPGRRRLHRRLAAALAPGRLDRRRGDRLLRRPLHGRDRLGPLAREDRADPRPRRRLLALGLDRRRPAARLEGRAPGRRGGDVRQHLGRGEGRDRLLLHLLERGQGRRAHLARARPRDRDPLRPRHVAGRLRRPRDGPARRPRALRPLPRLGRRVPRPRRHPPRRHHRTSAPSTPRPSS